MGGGGSSPHPPASIRHTIRKKNEGKQCRPPVGQPPNRPRRIRTGARQSPDEKGRPENKPIRLPSGHHPLSARYPRHQSPQQEPIPPGIHAAQSVPQPSRPQSRAQPQAQPVNLLEAGKSQPAKSHTPPHPRPSSSPVKNSHAGVAAQRGNPCFAKRSKPRFLPGATIMRRGCSATGAAGPIPRERTGAASSTARRSAVPGWICSTERVVVSLNSCLTKQKITILCGEFRITGKRPAYSCRFLSFCCNLAATLAISWRSASVIPVDTCTSSAGLSPAESRTKTAALVFPAMACATCASVIAS